MSASNNNMEHVDLEMQYQPAREQMSVDAASAPSQIEENTTDKKRTVLGMRGGGIIRKLYM
ncbi:hypothetical protein Tdes44962_MAKER03834 [Teratosphaeria destructans]|uniref:Uncharacterized protein n=1 Tax=Teratosphaeria destructans TaxID=418781 RepID=A0A9W7SNW4_9PEZI|nr:hypothetical protein Tdes44962_MAKER03834 [Teratosphaeria destructans]